jgi:cell division septation protein DedD
MKNLSILILSYIALCSCSPVLQKEVIEKSAEDKNIQNLPQSENKVLPRSLDYLRSDEIHWKWGSSRSGTEEKADNNMLTDQRKTMDAKKVLTTTEGQKIDDKTSPAVAQDMVVEKPETPELPDSGIHPDMNEKTEELQKAEQRITAEKPIVQEKKPDHDKYYVQIGAWKNPGLAETMLNNIKKFYPDTYILFENDLHKIRIPGVKTKEAGIHISKDIEKKFNIKSMVIMNPQ